MSDTSERTSSEAPQAASEAAAHANATAVAASEAQAAPAESGTETAHAAPAPAADGGGEHAAPEGQESQDGDDGDDGEGEGTEATSSAGEQTAEGAPGATPGKRKRRRRKKRKDGAAGSAGGATSAGDVRAEGEGGGSGNQARKKESHAPFAHFFTGAQANKRHAFAVGEVVAGRVQKVDHGVIVVDLFGKAIAVVDEYEPREIPILPEPSAAQPDDKADANAEAATPAADGGEAVAAASATTVSAEPSANQTLIGLGLPAVSLSSSADTGAPEAASTSAVVAPDADALAASPSAHDEAHADTHDHDAHDAHDDESDDDDAHEDRHEDGHEDSHEDGHEDTEAGAAAPAREKPEAPKLGQVFKGRVGAVSESGHIALLNRIIDGKAVRAELEQRRTEHKRVEGVVYGFNRGGFDVLVEGLRAFCPASAMSLEDIADPLEYVGKKLEFLLPASKAGSKDIIVSRRSILERQARRKTKEFLRTITPGQKFKGKVTAVRDFGLFVDIGGVEGLVHQSELSYAFGVKPNNVAKPGDEIDVQVLKVGGDPKGNGRESGNKRDRLTRVSLSVKALLTDPWDQNAEALAEGSVHKGKVVRATEFGAFIEIVDSIEGLLHITELGHDLKHANQSVKEGDEIYVAIERLDRRQRRISLSKLSPAEVKDFEAGTLTRDDAATRNLKQGQNVKLKVEKIEPRCVYARVAGTVGRRGRAFLPNSETGTERGTDLRKKFPLGMEFEAKIIGIDRDGSLKCSIKAMEIDEERKAVKDYRREASKQGFGTFGDLLRAKLGQ